MTRRPLLLLLPLLASLQLAHATEWHVAPNGDDNHPGTSPGKAFRTLQKAESVVQPGDIVTVAGGDYQSDRSTDKRDGSALLLIRHAGRPDAWITWRARKGETPVLHPRGWAGISVEASYHVIDGFTVLGANDEIALTDAIAAAKKTEKDPYFNTNGIVIEGRKVPADRKPHHVVVRNCVVGKMPGGGITGLEADYVTLEDNKVFDNAWYMEYAGSGITFLNNWAFDDAPGYHIIIRRNMVWNNRTMVPWNTTGKLSDGNGILLDVTDQATANGATNPNADASVAATNPNGDAVVKKEAPEAKPRRPIWTGRALIANNLSAFNGGSGIHTFRTAHVDIVNNTTYWNGAAVNYQELFPNRSDDVVIMNNVIVPRPGPSARVTSDNRNTNIKWDYNLYPAEQNVFRGPHDIVADPQFVAPGRDLLRADFRLKPGSAARDSGGPALPQPEALDRTPRPAGAGRDRGAYEQ
jgi:hypothetical protein